MPRRCTRRRVRESRLMALHNLEHLRTFVTVLRSGSLSEAARLIGVSQPTASSHVHSLEQQLGVRLFERTPSGMVATPRAVELGGEVAPHIDALDDLAYMTLASGGSDSIHLGGPAEFLSTAILPRLSELSDAARALIHVRFGLADALLEQLRTGELDIVVSAVQPRVRGVRGAPIFDEEFALVAAPSWKAVLPGAAAPDVELAALPVIAYAENLPIIRRYWRSVFDRRPDDLDVRAVIPDLRGIRDALVGGAGMSVLPRYLIEDELGSGALVSLHEPQVSPLNTVYLATRTGQLERNRQLRDVTACIERIARA
jgi:DNA-binding transcriptional LysR family regulator